MLKCEDKMSELQELLDSDDELPTTYSEVPETPAYLDDTRFDAIQFTWLNRGQARKCPKKKEAIVAPIKLSLETYEEQSTVESSPAVCQNTKSSMEKHLLGPFTYHEDHSIQYLRKTYDKQDTNGGIRQQSRNRTLMKKGLLNQQDILCMKSFAAHTSDEATLIWFIDFLIYKDLQSDYKFLTSCLVGQQLNQEGLNSPNLNLPQICDNHFDLVVT